LKMIDRNERESRMTGDLVRQFVNDFYVGHVKAKCRRVHSA